MTQIYEPMRTPSGVAAEKGAGWVVFAAIMLIVTGSINVIQGFVALFKDGYFVTRSADQLLFTDFTAWGVVMLIWGALLVGAGLGLMARKGWARWAAIVVA